MPEIYNSNKNPQNTSQNPGKQPPAFQEKQVDETTNSHSAFDVAGSQNSQPTNRSHISESVVGSGPTKHVDEYSETLKEEEPSHNPLTSFAPKPQRVTFDSQMNGEHIVLMLRRHPITQLKPILIAVIAFFLPLLLHSSPVIEFLTPSLKVAVVAGWYLLLTSFILESFLVWFFSVYIVTDERIIDVDFTSLIYKNMSSAKIENIEDITVATGGVLASLIDFGTVYIQTAAETPEIEFEDVPHPSKIARALNELILEEEREKIEGRVR